MKNKILKIIKIFFINNHKLDFLALYLRFFPEFLIEEIADEFFFQGQKKNASVIWTLLKNKENKRLRNAKYYVISTKGLYAFGEFMSRIDIIIKSMNLNLINKKPLKIYLQKQFVPNELFLKMIEDKVTIIEIPKKNTFDYIKYFFDKKYLLRPALLNLNGKVFHNSDFFPYLLKLSRNDISWKIPVNYITAYNEFLRNLIPNNIINNKKIIVIHIPETEGIHVCRNVSNQKTYISTIKYLIKHAYYVIRIGRRKNLPFFNLGNQYIDYSFVDNKPNGLDVYLLSISRFNILGSSGPNWIYYLFNTPTVLTNTFPVHHTGLLSNDIFIPKKIFIDKNEISLREMLRLGFDTPHISENIQYSIIDNTSEEILTATKEMIERFSKENLILSKNQILYKKIIESHLGFEGGGFISNKFIEDNAYLLA
jgi:putative glycosyltransferase (TIGR04372 family)